MARIDKRSLCVEPVLDARRVRNVVSKRKEQKSWLSKGDDVTTGQWLIGCRERIPQILSNVPLARLPGISLSHEYCKYRPVFVDWSSSFLAPVGGVE